MVNILITGGTGMVGSSIKRILNNNNSNIDNNNYYYISSKDYDLRNDKEVEKCFNVRKYDKIIHLAANVGGLYKNMQQNLIMLIDNLKINMNILEACHKYNIKRGIFCLSSCIYPKNPSSFPMNETQLNEGEPHDSNEGYAYSKRMMYVMCKYYNKYYDREYICLSPVNLYGINDNFNINEGHIIPSLINKMYKIKNNSNLKLEVCGSGIAKRQFLFSDDFAKIILLILDNEKIKEGIFNIGNNLEYTISEVINMIAQILNYDTNNIVYNDNFSDGILKKTITDNKLREIYPNLIYKPLYTGLTETIIWFINNQSIIRE